MKVKPPSSVHDHPTLALVQASSQAELCVRLRLAVEKAASRSADSMELLRIAVCDFTIALRNEGTTPEGVLIGLKSVIHEMSFPHIGSHASDSRGRPLREQITTWCIKEYFKEKTA